MKLSNNYTLAEFNRSATATSKGIDNTIPSAAINAIKILVKHLLQPINDATEWRNRINSGYRSPELNKAIGGVPTSMHVLGEAADCVFYSPEDGVIAPIVVARKVFELGLDFDQMIVYPSFVHLAFTSKRRNRRQFIYNKSYTGPRL